MGGAPTRFNEDVDDRLEHFDTHLQELEKNLLDASARRIHDFERRLEHEWLALRQLHEQPLKTLEQRTTVIAESSLNALGEALALLRSRLQPAPDSEPEHGSAQERGFAPEVAPLHSGSITSPLAIVLITALAALTVFSGYTLRSFGIELRETAARAAAAEMRVTQLQQLVERETRQTGQAVQRLTAEALSSAARAERLANVLAASDVRSYPLRGQRAAAASDGQVFFSPSRGIALTASKLPATPSNDVYQVWLVTTRGSIGLGFLSPDAQGRAGAAFETPSELSGTVTGFMLSLEPTGGNITPTGPIVLAS